MTGDVLVILALNKYFKSTDLTYVKGFQRFYLRELQNVRQTHVCEKPRYERRT